ncbi:hypothetical protein Tco_0628659 [Tanacetum coccineum]|uniref:Uncharacterized protein n=1 Tax=Tanacetum coccineum TaxID=301880 RepID=A0ABQ4WR08_9ASTR
MVEFWYSAKALENSKVSFLIPTGGIFGEVGVNTFRNAIGAHYLPHSSEYVAPPSINVVRQWFPTIGYGEEVLAKGTLRKSLLPPRLSQHILGGYHHQAEEETKGKDSKRQQKVGPLRHPLVPKLAILKREKSPTRPMDSNPSQPTVSTPVDTGMHKKDKQATCGPTSLGVTSEERANPQLSSGMSTFNLNKPIFSTSFIIHSESASGCDALADSTAEEEEASSTIKLEDLAKLVLNVEPSFKDLDSLEDDLVIVVDDSDEDEEDGVHPTPNAKTEDTLLLVKSRKTEFLNILSAHEFSSSLPTKLKDLPSKFNDLTEEVTGLKNQVHNLEIKLPRDLKEIPPKLEDFTKTVTSLTLQVAKLKTLQWELPVEFLVVLSQVEMVQSKMKTLDDLLSLLNKVTNALNQFAQAITSKKTRDKGKKALSSEEAKKESTDSDSDDETHVTGSMVEPYRTKKLTQFNFITEDGRNIHLTEEEINHQKKLEGDAKAEATKQEGEVRKVELVDLLGPKVVKKYYNDKLQYDKYCNKMLNRRAVSRITNFDVLTRKGPITLKLYREDGTSKVIPNLKASTRMDYIHTTEAELGINLDIHLSKQDSLNKLNDIENKKRKHTDEIHDYFKANKRLKSSVQYEDHLPRIVLNKPVLASSASALQVLRRLGSIFTSVYAAVQKLKKDSWKELQFSLVDNSKLNVVYLLNRKDPETKMEVETPYKLLKDDQMKQLGKNNEAKMTLYNALPRKEYERVFMCKTAKEVLLGSAHVIRIFIRLEIREPLGVTHL